MAAKEKLQAAKAEELTELEQLKRERSFLIEQLATVGRKPESVSGNIRRAVPLLKSTLPEALTCMYDCLLQELHR